MLRSSFSLDVFRFTAPEVALVALVCRARFILSLIICELREGKVGTAAAIRKDILLQSYHASTVTIFWYIWHFVFGFFFTFTTRLAHRTTGC